MPDQHNDSSQSFLRKYTIYTLAILPWFLCFLTSFVWILFTGPPSTSVLATLLWLAPMLISQVASIGFLIYHYNQRFDRDDNPTYEEAVLDLIKSTFCSLTLDSFCLWVLVLALRGLFSISNTEPTPDQDGQTQRIMVGELIMGALGVILSCGLLCALQIPILSMPYEDAKDVLKLRPRDYERFVEEGGAMVLQSLNHRINKWEEEDEDEDTINETEDSAESEWLSSSSSYSSE